MSGWLETRRAALFARSASYGHKVGWVEDPWVQGRLELMFHSCSTKKPCKSLSLFQHVSHKHLPQHVENEGLHRQCVHPLLLKEFPFWRCSIDEDPKPSPCAKPARVYRSEPARSVVTPLYWQGLRLFCTLMVEAINLLHVSGDIYSLQLHNHISVHLRGYKLLAVLISISKSASCIVEYLLPDILLANTYPRVSFCISGSAKKVHHAFS